MDAHNGGSAGTLRGATVEVTDRDLIVKRSFDAPAHVVYQAWTTPELFKRWWAPKSMGMTIRACEMDVRTGGTYRLEFGEDAESAVSFFGNYLEVVPNSRLVWTNDEGPDGAVTTVTFAETDGKTLVTYSETYPSKEALDAVAGMEETITESLEQLEELLASS